MRILKASQDLKSFWAQSLKSFWAQDLKTLWAQSFWARFHPCQYGRVGTWHYYNGVIKKLKTYLINNNIATVHKALE
jgi:hypothetical protein